MSCLKGKTVIVTGASEGIGQSIAWKLAEKGARLALIARNKTTLGTVAEEIQAKGYSAAAFACDIRHAGQIRETVRQIAAQFGTIDALINNAGIWQKLSPLNDIGDDAIRDVIETNLLGGIYMTKAVLPHLRQNNNDTSIINVISKSGVTAQEGQSIYTASKYGMKGFTDVLRIDLKNTSVHVGAVYQSGTNTRMFAKTGEDFLLQNFTAPDDLADAVAYMLSRPCKMWIPELHVSYS